MCFFFNPNNRPVYVNSAVNGHSAIEFWFANGHGSSSTYDQNISTSLEIPGGLFVTQTISFMVASSPTN